MGLPLLLSVGGLCSGRFLPFPKAPGVLFCGGVEKSGKQRSGAEGCGDLFAVA